jgi:GntR family transcriptional regulator
VWVLSNTIHVLHFYVDSNSGMPAYRQIMDQIGYYIASGVLVADAQLPSIRQLAKELRVNPSTVIKAYSELEHERIIEMRQGQGAFVAANPRTASAADREALLRKLVQPVAVQALQLNASPAAAARALRDEMERLQRQQGTNDA